MTTETLFKLLEPFFADEHGEIFEKQILNAENADNWPPISGLVGELLADIILLPLKECDIHNTSDSALTLWLASQLKSSDSWTRCFPGNVARFSPERLEHCDLNGKARHLLDHLTKDRSTAAFAEFSTFNVYVTNVNGIKLSNELQSKYIKAPESFLTGTFVADLIIQYYNLQALHGAEHNLRNKLIDAGNNFGSTLNKRMQSCARSFDDHKFWAEVALVAGFEVLRRFSTENRVNALLGHAYGPDDCLEAALRILGNTRIHSMNFLLCIAFAML